MSAADHAGAERGPLSQKGDGPGAGTGVADQAIVSALLIAEFEPLWISTRQPLLFGPYPDGFDALRGAMERYLWRVSIVYQASGNRLTTLQFRAFENGPLFWRLNWNSPILSHTNRGPNPKLIP